MRRPLTIVAIVVFSIYFLAGLPRIKVFAYQLVPHSRRPRVILITDQITVKVGGYVLGNVLTSAIAGVGTAGDDGGPIAWKRDTSPRIGELQAGAKSNHVERTRRTACQANTHSVRVLRLRQESSYGARA